MRIKEFSMRRYGPLSDTGVVIPDNFSLFFGNNEEGKTLLIDGLVKLMFHKKKDRKVFGNLNRVEENFPEGYLLIEDNEGREIKLPGEGDIGKITGLCSREWSNIFIIRDSDLSVSSEKGDFYREITNRLTGLRTKEISSILEKLRDLGALTRADSDASLSDSEACRKVKSRLSNARDLIEDIAGMEKEIEDEGLDRLEDKIAKITGRMEEVIKKIENLDLARKREEFERADKALASLKTAILHLEKLASYNPEDQGRWHESERDLKRLTKEEKIVNETLANQKQDYRQLKQEFTEKEKNFKIFAMKKREIDEEIRPEIKIYQKTREDLAFQKGKNKFLHTALPISSLLMAISMTGFMIRPSPLFIFCSLLFAAIIIISGFFNYLLIKKDSKLKSIMERISFGAGKLGLQGKGMEEILADIDKFHGYYSEREEELKEIDKKISLLAANIDKLNGGVITALADNIREFKNKIEALKNKSGEDNPAAYTEKLRSKEDWQLRKGQEEGVLKSRFGFPDKELAINLPHWDKKLFQLKEYRNKAQEITYSEMALLNLKKVKESLAAQKREIKEKMFGLREKLGDIERRTNEILRPFDDYFHCLTSVDLKAAGNRLDIFVSTIEKKRDNVLKVMKIFEEIAGEEEKKVSSLFGKTSPISHLFSDMTKGRYRTVNFRRGPGQIEVIGRDGIVLPAEKLSGGAYDQLYLSIRLALGEKLLKGNKGFFILDDPLLKADTKRLQIQLDILRKLSDSGWQIIYFTAKDEVKAALMGAIENNQVKYHEIEGD